MQLQNMVAATLFYFGCNTWMDLIVCVLLTFSLALQSKKKLKLNLHPKQWGLNKSHFKQTNFLLVFFLVYFWGALNLSKIKNHT